MRIPTLRRSSPRREMAQAEPLPGRRVPGFCRRLDPNRKLVKTQTAEMETTEFDAFTAWVQENIQKAGGYIENASVSGKETGGTAFRHASYVLRIPETGLDTFMEELKTEGNVLYYTESVEDITLNYTRYGKPHRSPGTGAGGADGHALPSQAIWILCWRFRAG